MQFKFFISGAIAAGLVVSALVHTALVPTQTRLSGAVGGGLILPASGPRLVQVDPNQPILPLPAVEPDDQRKIELGRELFHDPRLSRGGIMSCASCHDLARGGVDGRPRAVGRDGSPIGFNTLSVYNSSLNVAQSWAGVAATLEDQIDRPLHHPNQFASTWPEVLNAISAIPTYQAAFRQIYPDGISEASVKNAIATFERSLITTGAPLDRFLLGDENALTDKELRGFRLFTELGCASCHQGRNIGGNMYQIMGIFGDYFADRGETSDFDLGRYNVTGDPADRHVFRVPSLRNVAVTAPYFHDGSVATLGQAIRIMARYQLGRDVTDAQLTDIAAFLGALTGDLR